LGYDPAFHQYSQHRIDRGLMAAWKKDIIKALTNLGGTAQYEDLYDETKLEDLALLCAHCYRVVHSSRRWLTVDKFVPRSRLRTGYKCIRIGQKFPGLTKGKGSALTLYF
jgi:sigma54-dependent transcription regulator